MAQTPLELNQCIEQIVPPAVSGRYDELLDASGALRPQWRSFFARFGDASSLSALAHHQAVIARRIHDDGVTYNAYSAETGTQRPWSLDVLPFIIDAAEWQQIEQGVAQRAALLSAVMRDIYGPQRLLQQSMLPPALVFGHASGYLRPLAGVKPLGNTFLHIVAFDLARDVSGRWCVVTQRTQAPSGLGYALQNRLIVSRLYPEAFRELHAQRLAASYRRLMNSLNRLSLSDAGDANAGPPRVVLLTPGPFNETYFEHAYLAGYLGIPLVEGSDLTVRDDCVFLKTVYGLERVHAILRRLDDDFCDPLELRPDSALGVPGLLQAVRAGQVLIANALGSGFLESPAINGFLPAICKRLLGQELLLPSLDSWWCGEAAAYRAVRDRLGEMVIKPTYPSTPARPRFNPLIGADASEEQLNVWRARIEADPDAYTVQDYVPLSQTVSWSAAGLGRSAAMVRVYALADATPEGVQWHVLPGGLTRIASIGGGDGRDQPVVALQRGGSSMDTWVLTSGPVDAFSMLPLPLTPQEVAEKRQTVTSHAAENLFWMGRYVERAEFTVRLARCALLLLRDDSDAPPVVFDALAELCVNHGLVPKGVPLPKKSSTQSAAVFERTLLAGLNDAKDATSIAFNLQSLETASNEVRERLSDDHCRLLRTAAEQFAQASTRDARDGVLEADDALAALSELALVLQAVTGAQSDRMTRDDGWRLLTIGWHIERLTTLADVLDVLFAHGAAHEPHGFELLLRLFDSSITYRSLYQRRQEMAPLLDLLVLDAANPRSLRCIADALRLEQQRLPGAAQLPVDVRLPDDWLWPDLKTLCVWDDDGHYTALHELVTTLGKAGYDLSDAISTHYFSHAGTYVVVSG